MEKRLLAAERHRAMRNAAFPVSGARSGEQPPWYTPCTFRGRDRVDETPNRERIKRDGLVELGGDKEANHAASARSAVRFHGEMSPAETSILTCGLRTDISGGKM